MDQDRCSGYVQGFNASGLSRHSKAPCAASLCGTEGTEISRGKVKDFLLDKINNGYAASTVTHIKNVISGVLNKALDDEVIQALPTG